MSTLHQSLKIVTVAIYLIYLFDNTEKRTRVREDAVDSSDSLHTGGAMKCMVLGFVLWFTITLSSSARSADEMYPVIALRASIVEEIKKEDNWKACGDYFAAGETANGKIIHFAFKKKSTPKSETVFAFGPIERIIISIDRGVPTPVTIVRGTWVTVIMSPEDYLAGLPCLANGKGV